MKYKRSSTYNLCNLQLSDFMTDCHCMPGIGVQCTPMNVQELLHHYADNSNHRKISRASYLFVYLIIPTAALEEISELTAILFLTPDLKDL